MQYICCSVCDEVMSAEIIDGIVHKECPKLAFMTKDKFICENCLKDFLKNDF